MNCKDPQLNNYMQQNIKEASCLDNRDSDNPKIYKIIKVTLNAAFMEQIWMAENLNYDPKTGNSWCYDDDPDNCEIYGRLYDWATAMNLPEYCNTITNTTMACYGIPSQGLCPAGWHVSTKEEWDILQTAIPQNLGMAYALKAPGFWPENTANDYLGFSALPGGLRNIGNKIFDYRTTRGYWWTATPATTSTSYSIVMTDRENTLSIDTYQKNFYGFSVRCIMNNQ